MHCLCRTDAPVFLANTRNKRWAVNWRLLIVLQISRQFCQSTDISFMNVVTRLKCTIKGNPRCIWPIGFKIFVAAIPNHYPYKVQTPPYAVELLRLSWRWRVRHLKMKIANAPKLACFLPRRTITFVASVLKYLCQESEKDSFLKDVNNLVTRLWICFRLKCTSEEKWD